MQSSVDVRSRRRTLWLWGCAVLVLGCVTACTRAPDVPAAVWASYRDDAEYTGLTVDYPLDGTLFPPELAPPTFQWHDGNPRVDAWALAFRFADGRAPLRCTTDKPQWTPDEAQWTEIQRRTREQDARVIVLGVQRAAPGTILSGARIAIRTSADEVGAPLFYREVNLPFAEAVKDPSRIRWRFGPVSSRQPPPIVLENLPVCGNCHSFSTDGAMLGMDVDYANDKGSYALTPVRREMPLATSDLITWSDFRRDDGQATFGLLSQVSPDGRYVVSTVKDRSVFVAKPELAFSQLFFPIRGILAVYDRMTQTFSALPGADDPEYVQSNATWSPDGQTIIFARAKAHHLKQDSGQVLLTKEECAEFLEEGRTFLFDLYRVPFNGGAGGVAEPLSGASQNGRSNYFAKFSPDGKWIVFCQSRSYMLLQPDSELYIMPAAGGAPRRMPCNTGRMNSWHSWSPNGKWLVFSSKAVSDYTQLYLTHIDAEGNSTPAVRLAALTAPDRAANIPEFVNATPDAIAKIGTAFIDDVSYVRAADAFLRAHDVDGAVRQFRKALELNPQNAIAHSNLGGVLVTQGAVEEGVTHLKEALRLDPTNGSPYYNLGMLRAREGKVDEAVELLTRAVRYRPEIADAQRVLGALLCNRGAVAEGVRHLSEAARLDPRDAVARFCLGKAQAAQGRMADAVRELSAAVQLNADYVEALHLLGQLLVQQGRGAEALGPLERAAALQADDARILVDLAWLLATCPDPRLRDAPRAIQLARRACEFTDYQAFAALGVLAVCHAAAGQFPDAIRAAEQARQLALDAGETQIAAGIAEQIESYQRGQAYLPPAAPPPPAGGRP